MIGFIGPCLVSLKGVWFGRGRGQWGLGLEGLGGKGEGDGGISIQKHLLQECYSICTKHPGVNFNHLKEPTRKPAKHVAG